jgi:hypothetical protein
MQIPELAAQLGAIRTVFDVETVRHNDNLFARKNISQFTADEFRNADRFREILECELIEGLQRRQHMSRQYEPGALCREARDARWYVIASYMRVDDIDVIVTGKLRDLHSTQNAKGMSDGNVEDMFIGKKRQPLLPITCRTQRDKHVMPACIKTATQIDHMPFSSCVMPRG